MRLLPLLVVFLFFCLDATAEIIGTYQGGFDTTQAKLKVELRCESQSVCEIQVETGNDEARSPSESLERLEKFPLEPLGGCSQEPFDEWSNCVPIYWQGVKKALEFSRGRKSFVEPEVAKVLSPFLNSSSSITKCFSMAGFNNRDKIVCELTDSPWKRPAILYLEPQLFPCDGNAFYCTYRFLPLFKTSEKAEIRSRRNALLPPKYSGPPPQQQAVADYVKELDDKIKGFINLPENAAASAALDYQIQFNQETGGIASVNFVGGCYCPGFKQEVKSAVMKARPLPLLPKEKWSALGGRMAKVYLHISAQ